MIVIYQKSWDLNAQIAGTASAFAAYSTLSTAHDVTLVYDWCANENVGVECDTDEEYAAVDAL